MQERLRTGETALFTTKVVTIQVQAKIFIHPHLHNVMHANRTLPRHTPPMTERSFWDPSKRPCDPYGRSLQRSSVEPRSFQCRGGPIMGETALCRKVALIQRMPTLFFIHHHLHSPAYTSWLKSRHLSLLPAPQSRKWAKSHLFRKWCVFPHFSFFFQL